MGTLSHADVTRIVGSLLDAAGAAADGGTVCRRWLTAADPDAELALVYDGETLRGFRRDGPRWSSVSLPPVAPDSVATAPEIRNLTNDRRDPLDDLTFALGFPQTLTLPVGRSAAWQVVLARTAPPYDEGDLHAHVTRAEWLTRLLEARPRGDSPRREDEATTRELATLLDLVRDLGRPLGADAAVAAASRSLAAMLGAAAGAVTARLATGESPIVAGWPDGPSWDPVARAIHDGPHGEPRRVDDATLGIAGGEGLAWVAPGGDEPLTGYPAVRIVLGFRGPLPDEVERVAEFVRTALVQALDRHAAQREREEARLRAALEALPVGVLLLGEGGRVRLSNRSADALLKSVDAAPAPGGALGAIGPVELAPLVARALSEGGASTEAFLPDAGRTLSIELIPSGARGIEAGSPRDVLLLVDDVTEARQRTRHLARAEKLSALGVLVAGIVHEINNPLSTVLGYAEMLARDPSADQRERWIGTLREEGERCRRIVGNMLHLVRDRDPEQRPVALGELAERALSLVAQPYRAQRIEASLETHPDTPIVTGEPDGLLQVFINLLTNAMHALEGRDGANKVHVRLAPHASGGAEIVVRDTGPGIDAATIDRVFDPFFTTKPEGKGTGLGLGLVASTIERHGGTIDVESGPGAGATFRIVLPAGEAEERAEGEGRARASGLCDGLTILIADDEPEVAALLAELFEGEGAAVEIVGDAESTIARAGAFLYDALIVDLTMPRCAPDELLDQLDAAQPGSAARVVFCSGATPPETARLGGRPCLAKPFDFAAVIDAVRAAVDDARR